MRVDYSKVDNPLYPLLLLGRGLFIAIGWSCGVFVFFVLATLHLYPKHEKPHQTHNSI